MADLWAVIVAEDDGKRYAYASQFDPRTNIAFWLRDAEIVSLYVTPYRHVAHDWVKELNDKLKGE